MTNGRRITDQEFTRSISTFAFPLLIGILGFFLYQYFHGVDQMKAIQGTLVKDVAVHKVEFQNLRDRVQRLESKR